MSDVPPKPDPEAPGALIGRFVIAKRIGEGGMGVVLAAHDPDHDRMVAIKLLRREHDVPSYRARLLREGQAMARIDHPNVVRLYEIGSDHERLFVVMELVDSTTLTAWLHAEQRSWRDIVAMFAQAGAGLGAAHRAGIIHRDFKPENVLVDRTGRARVADFGLARPDREISSRGVHLASLSNANMQVGTPGYMAPEQETGGKVDARADQYSFCVALREALLRWPATGEAPDWRDVPIAIRDALDRGLAHAAVDRFPTMEHLLAALEGKPPPGRRRRLAIAALAILAVALAAVVLWRT